MNQDPNYNVERKHQLQPNLDQVESQGHHQSHIEEPEETIMHFMIQIRWMNNFAAGISLWEIKIRYEALLFVLNVFQH